MSDTKTKILDSAEKLFAHHGIDATSLRQITADAGVNLAAVNYHFRSKDSLIEAVVGRRIQPINERRIRMLDEFERDGPATPEQIAAAFLLPVLEAGEEFVNLRPMMGRLLAAPNDFLNRVYKTHLAGIASRFAASLGKTLPHLSQQDLLWRLHFMAGAMAHTIAWSRVFPAITNGLCDVSDTKALARRLIEFVAAGLKAPVTGTEDWS